MATENLKPQITEHYGDGRPSITRDMTEEEIAALPQPVTQSIIDELATE